MKMIEQTLSLHGYKTFGKTNLSEWTQTLLRCDVCINYIICILIYVYYINILILIYVYYIIIFIYIIYIYYIIYHISYIIYHISYIIYHISYIILYIICYMLYVIYYVCILCTYVYHFMSWYCHRITQVEVQRAAARARRSVPCGPSWIPVTKLLGETLRSPRRPLARWPLLCKEWGFHRDL